MCHLVMFQAQRGGLEVVWQTQPSKFLAVQILVLRQEQEDHTQGNNIKCKK